MGNVVPTGRAGEEPQQLVASIDDSRLLFQDELWNGKFLKSARCQSSGNVLVVKVYEKIPATDPQLLRKLRKQLEDLREQVRPATHPNVLAYTRWGETSRVAYVMRQFTSSNLHDRQNTRPFLAPMEKRWIVYQMLKALSQCHGSGIVHGDIKAENFLVTSHTWVLLADFAPYKPTFLPLDDTAPYNYFFDSSNKRDCCCVAPERFRSPTSIIDISLLDSAPPQCASVLSVMMDPGVPDVDAEFELAEASASLEAEDRAAAAKRDGLAEGGDSGSAGASREASMGGGGSKVLRKSGNSGPKSLGTSTASAGGAGARLAAGMSGSSSGNTATPSIPERSAGSSAVSSSSQGRAATASPPGRGNAPKGLVRRQRSYSFDTQSRSTRLRPSMDIFSLGCVIAELYMDGAACFNLSEVLRYANPDLGADARATLLQSKLDKVTDPLIRPLVESMLQADPSQRKSADVYLQEFTGPNKAFPSYFADVLHPFFRELLQEEYDSPDERIWAVCRRYEELVSALCNIHDKRGAAYFAQQSAAWAARHAALDVSLKDSPMRSVQDDLDGDGGAGSERSRGSTGGGGEESTRASRGDNEAVRDLLARTQKIMAQLADLNVSDKMRAAVTSASENVSLQYDALSKQYSAAPPPPPLDFTGSLSGGGEDFFLVGGPGARGVEATSDSYAASPSALNIPAGENGVLIVIHMLAATIRFVRFPSTKVAALCALLRLSRFSNDETRLQRVLPYVVHELCESSSREFSSLVRCTALRALTDLVRKIKRLPASDRRIFPEYIFPALARFKMDPSLNARLTFAECLPRLAEASGRFLDLARLHADLSNSDAADCHTGRESSSSIRGKGKSGDDALAKPVTFDAQLNELHDIVQDFVSNMIEQPAVVRRTLLCDITRLCLFFGRERTSSHVLPILITCLSERNDWQLRATFFEHIPGVSALVGPLALQQFLLPCIVQSLYEFEELVVERTLTCVYSLTQLGLLDVTMMSELAAKVGPLVYHPSVWIRNAVVRVLAALVASKRMGLVETQVTIVRLIEPYLKKSEARNALLLGCSKNVEENEALLREMLVDRLPRDVYEAAAERVEKKAFPQASSKSSEAGRSRSAKETPSKLPPGTPSFPTSSSPSISASASSSSTTTSIAGQTSSKSASSRSRSAAPGDASAVAGSSSSGTGSTWLKLSHRTPKKSDSSSANAGDENAGAMAAQKLPPHHAQGLKALEGFFKASASLARGTRGRLMELEKEIPETVVRSLRSGPDDAALHAILVPEQTYVTLAIHSRYADFLDQSASTAGPGLLLQHQHPDFKRIVNRYGIVALSRRHGAGAADTSEALSGGQQRLTQRIRALEVPPLPPDMATLRKLDGTPYVATVRRPSSEVGSLLEPADASSTRDAASTPNDRPWRPRGVLAANLYGHDNAVNRVVASQDNLFFATGSDDGTVRLWMTAGLEDGYGIRPKLTYASQGGCIADLCIVENTHAVAAASTSGSVHVFKVEHALDVTRAAVDPNDMMGGPSSSVVINSGDGTSEDLLLDKAEARHAHARSAADAAMREERNARGSLSAGLAGGGAHGNGNTSIGTTVSGMGSNAGPGAGASGSTVPGVGANSSSSSSQSFSHGTQRGSSQQRSLGASTVLELNLARDGPVRAICHYPAVSESVLVCASESGAVHGWDLRARKRSWVLRVGPQAGVITALAVPPEGDPIWLVAGTSRGVILLYDLRFSILLKAWRHPSHSRIHRLYLSRATCSDPFVYVAAGVNSTSLYNVSDGAMVHSYRTVPTSVKGKDATADAPLEEIDVRALEVNPSIPEPMWSQLAVDELDASTARMEPSVRAIVCPFDMSDVRKHMAHIPTTVITAGTDRRIRYWNQDHNLCYSVFDQEFGRSVNQHWDRLGKVVVCREDIAGHQAIGQAQPAQRQQSQFSAEGRGLPHPSTNHEDAILDLAFLAAPSRLGGTLTQRASTGLLLSASRDGIVKAWA